MEIQCGLIHRDTNGMGTFSEFCFLIDGGVVVVEEMQEKDSFCRWLYMLDFPRMQTYLNNCWCIIRCQRLSSDGDLTSAFPIRLQATHPSPFK